MHMKLTHLSLLYFCFGLSAIASELFEYESFSKFLFEIHFVGHSHVSPSPKDQDHLTPRW